MSQAKDLLMSHHRRSASARGTRGSLVTDMEETKLRLRPQKMETCAFLMVTGGGFTYSCEAALARSPHTISWTSAVESSTVALEQLVPNFLEMTVPTGPTTRTYARKSTEA